MKPSPLIKHLRYLTALRKYHATRPIGRYRTVELPFGKTALVRDSWRPGEVFASPGDGTRYRVADDGSLRRI